MRKNNKNAGSKKSSTDWFAIRVKVVMSILLLWFCVLGGRVVELTLFSDQRVAAYSERQGNGPVKIDLPRGMIYDRNFNELAVSIQTHSVYLNPRKVDNPEDVAARLAGILEPRDLRARNKVRRSLVKTIKRKRNKQFIWVRRKLEEDVYKAVRTAQITGVGFVKEAKRYYPKRDTAARIIGFAGMDDQGLYGIEYLYDKIIRPTSSRFTVLKDALGRPVSMPDAMTISEKSAPKDLQLTIDERIQYIAEAALEKQVAFTHARRGVVIVMEPATGDVLAIAEMPKFNPNNYSSYGKGRYASRAVSNALEPGSTFKLFVVAAAIEGKLAYPYMKINCEKGAYRVAGHTIREANRKRYGILTVSEVIQKSSNIGAIKLAEKLGPKALYAGLTRFGFGSKTGVDLPGESPGLLRKVSSWSKSSLSAISFGQEVGVTPLQLITGVSVFANGGFLVRPNIVRATLRDDSAPVRTRLVQSKRVISKATALMVRDMMVKVVEDGTGKRAATPGFSVAGKSGTAQKFDSAKGAYSEDKFLSSFVGFFPAEKPRLTILVMIDEPEGVAWGGQVAGPVFSEVAARSARVLRIPSSLTDVYEIDWSGVADDGAAHGI